jgi:hypothetical protein
VVIRDCCGEPSVGYSVVELALSMAGAMTRDDEKKFGAPAVYPE